MANNEEISIETTGDHTTAVQEIAAPGEIEPAISASPVEVVEALRIFSDKVAKQ